MSYSITLPPGRYAMLLRKSREDEEAEAEGQYETLRYHEQQLNRLADGLGITIAEHDVYRELTSGEILANCHDVMRLIRAVSTGMYAGVLVVDSQRLTRGDPVDRGTILSAFTYSHTLIITPRRFFDPTDDNDMFMLEIELLFGRRELGTINYRFANGKINKSNDGQYLGARAPFGWDKVVVDRRKTLRPNADAPMVVQWYEDLAAGRTTCSRIADDLNARGIPSPTGALWTALTVSQIIRNPVNKGYVRWGAQKTITEFTADFQKVKRRVRADEDEVVLKKGLHEGIVSEELWAAAVANITHETRARRGFERRDPLAGLLVCAGCGRGMHRVTCGEGIPERYTHPRVNRRECWQTGSSIAEVMELLSNSLQEVCADMAVADDSGEDERQATIKRADLLEADAKEAQAGIERLFRLVEKGFIEDEDFYARKVRLDERIKEDRRQAAMLRGEAEGMLDTEQRVVYLRQAIAEIENYEGRAREVNEVLKRLLERIEYRKEKGGKPHIEVWLR